MCIQLLLAFRDKEKNRTICLYRYIKNKIKFQSILQMVYIITFGSVDVMIHGCGKEHEATA